MIVFLLAYVLFGYFLIRLLKLERTFSLVERMVLALILGVSAVTSAIALVGEFFSVGAYNILFISAGLGLYSGNMFIKDVRASLQLLADNKKLLWLPALLTIMFVSTMIFSHWRSDGSVQIFGLHDSVWHVALINNLQETIPPLHPSTPQIALNNYHYFYDLFLASIVKYSILTPFVAYFQFSVVLLSLLLISTAYVLGRRLHSKIAGALLSLFTIVTGSFAYLIPLFIPGQIWHESSFWVSQTLVMIVNPQIIYTLSISFVVFLLFYILLQAKVDSFRYLSLHLLLITLIATSIGFKTYAWIILSVIYAVYLLIELIKYRKLRSILVGLTYLVVSLPYFWMITSFQTGSFFYEPLWFTNTMMESPDRVFYLEWKFLQDHYVATNNWIRLTILETQKIFIFYVGNMSIRILAFVLPVLLFFNMKLRTKYGLFSILLLIGFLFSTIFPLLYLQRGTVWNSIQFFYYALIFANIAMVLVLVELFKKKLFSKLFAGVILGLLVITLPTSIKTIRDELHNPHNLSQEEASFLNALESTDYISICPDGSDFYKTSLVKAISSAQVYLANPSQIALVGSDTSLQDEYEELYRQRNVADLKQFYSSNDITYIICTDQTLSEDLAERLMVDVMRKGKLFILKLSE